jgi:hypothetical protein
MSSLDNDLGNGAPNNLLCPISRCLMADPVTAADGHTYERSSIETWFKRNSTSPMTNEYMTSEQLIPNFNLKSTISQWLQENPTGHCVENNEEKGDDDDDAEDKVAPIDEKQIEKNKNYIQIFVRSPIGGDLRTLNVLPTSTLAQVSELLLRKSGIVCPSGKSILLRTGTKSFLTIKEDGMKTLLSCGINKEATLTTKFIKTSGDSKMSSSTNEDMKLQSLIIECSRKLLATFVPLNATMYSIQLRYWITKGLENDKVWETCYPSKFSLWTDFHKIEDGWYSGSTPKRMSKVYEWLHVFNEEDTERSQLQFHIRQELEDQGRLSRMDTAKQLFTAYLDRTKAYDLKNSLGLITYGSECRELVRELFTILLNTIFTCCININ